ncbi:MAG TPA: lysophospholipid acyltransferase family protein [Roseococcus sp.]|nr:lysophospholipid acyltransferase family protein [Roseococcus sp.]
MSAARGVAFKLWMYGLLVVMGLLWLPSLLLPRGFAMAGLRLWVRLVLGGLRVICGVRVEVRGLEHRPAGAMLIAAKHQSMLDTIAPFVVLGDPAYVLKQELLSLPFYGWYARKLGHIAVNREAHAAALKKMVADARSRLADGRAVLIFPEGTRQEPGAAPDYKPGVAALYRDLGLPCALLATNSGEFWPAQGSRFRPGVAVFEFLEPIPPGLKRGAFMQQLQERIECASTALLTGPKG